MGGHLHLHLHLLLHHLHSSRGRKEPPTNVPKGCVAVMVGAEGEEQQRFVVPVDRFSHPLFLRLLKEAEEEYGFHQKGAIAIPCPVSEFRYVQDLISRKASDDDDDHHHHHHRGHLAGCFKG